MKTYSYYLSSEKGEGWGKFIIDASGYFSAVSDYGNYAFNWGSFGEKDFRVFLCDLNWDYLAGKLGRRDWFDSYKTKESIKRLIIEQRKENGTTKEEAREVWDSMPNSCDGQRAFMEYLEENWKFFQDISGIMDFDYPPDLMAFAKRLYPRFVKELKKEMLIEKGCDHSERQEPESLCNINHQGQAHRLCSECNEVCGYDPNDCPHIFAVQVCDCGKQFIGALGKKYKCDELVDHKD